MYYKFSWFAFLYPARKIVFGNTEIIKYTYILSLPDTETIGCMQAKERKVLSFSACLCVEMVMIGKTKDFHSWTLLGYNIYNALNKERACSMLRQQAT